MRNCRLAEILILIFFVSLISCKNTSSGGPYEVFKNLSGVSNYSEAKKYFTSGTIESIDAAVSKGIISDLERLSTLTLLGPGVKWEIVNIANYGNVAGVTLKFTHHPVENLKGAEIVYSAVQEGGAWKIDMEKELKESLSAHSPEKAEEYFKSLLK